MHVTFALCDVTLWKYDITNYLCHSWTLLEKSVQFAQISCSAIFHIGASLDQIYFIVIKISKMYKILISLEIGSTTQKFFLHKLSLC